MHSPEDAISSSQNGNLTLKQTRNEAPPIPSLFLVKMSRDRNEITRCFSGSPLEFLYVCHWRACCSLQLVKHHIEKSPVGAFHSWCLICVDNNSVYTHVARSLSHTVAPLRIKRPNKCFLLQHNFPFMHFHFQKNPSCSIYAPGSSYRKVSAFTSNCPFCSTELCFKNTLHNMTSPLSRSSCFPLADSSTATQMAVARVRLR